MEVIFSCSRKIVLKPLFLCLTLCCLGNVVYSSPFLGAERSYIYSDTSNKRLIVSYHTNGKVKEKGYQGYYSNRVISTGTYIGTWNTYDENGHLIQSVYYYNDIPSKAFIEKKKYYTNGKLESIEKFNNYELYESEIDTIGTWKYFNRQGKLIRKISHKRQKADDDN
jgi:antitoxin component YwqK of YwqJK toxin-antitoxin module